MEEVDLEQTKPPPQGGLDVEELDLGDDLLALEPQFQRDPEDEDDEDVDENYRFNEKSKITPKTKGIRSKQKIRSSCTFRRKWR